MNKETSVKSVWEAMVENNRKSGWSENTWNDQIAEILKEN